MKEVAYTNSPNEATRRFDSFAEAVGSARKDLSVCRIVHVEANGKRTVYVRPKEEWVVYTYEMLKASDPESRFTPCRTCLNMPCSCP